MEQVSRLLSHDALAGVVLVTVALHVVLLARREWTALLVFHVAGACNFALELGMIAAGTRIVDDPGAWGWLALVEVGWVDAGWFACLPLVNGRWWWTGRPGKDLTVWLANLLFFVALPPLLLDWGPLDGQVLTARLSDAPVGKLVLQSALVLLPLAWLVLAGRRRVALFIALHGGLLGLWFQGRMYLAGIRQASQAGLLTMVVDTLTLATIPAALGVLWLLARGHLPLPRYGDPPPYCGPTREVHKGLAALQALRRAGLSVSELLRVLVRLGRGRARGEPWAELAPAETAKDRESRAQAGDAVLLYRALSTLRDPETARDITAAVVLDAAIAHLYATVPLLRRADLEPLSEAERQQRVFALIDSFPNTELTVQDSAEDEFRYEVNRCRLVELVQAVGHPELSGIFCAGDRIYFERHQPEVCFHRPTTIGDGDGRCDFSFTLRGPER